jgi:hypothetical protein
VTKYPSISDYNQSAQNPSKSFTDPELSGGSLATSGLGLPIVLGGGFALTYTVTSKAQKIAVRCFHRYVPDLKQRYAQISDAIDGLCSKHFVSFEYQREGVRVKSELYPVVKMAWAEGPTFGAFMEDNYDNAAAVRSLSSSFHELSRFLASRGIAHGDLDNGNIVVRSGSLTLVDYDGMYVPGMPLGNGNELGHANFQHPGRTHAHFGPRIDDFSFILIDISLEAIAHNPDLYERFCDGDNLLFQKSDLENPSASPVFKELRSMRPMAKKVDDFATICKRPIEKVPSLDEFLAKHSKAGSAPTAPKAPATPAQPRPQGMSNLDYIRSTMGKTEPGPMAGKTQPAAAPNAAGSTGGQLSNWFANVTTTLREDAESRLSWGLGVLIVAVVLLVLFAGL